jgi:very-short-patch-repair endonuclease
MAQDLASKRITHTPGRSRGVAAERPHGNDDRAHPVRLLGVGGLFLVRGSRDQRVAAIAALQRGRVSRRQLLEAGLSAGMIDRMVSRGRLHRLHAGVYAVGHLAPVELGEETAALLASPEGAALSHHSAAALWKLRPRLADVVDVTVRAGHDVRRSGIHAHRSRRLPTRDVRVRERLPVTSPARTLLDIAELVTERELERALDEALVTRIARRSQIQDVLERAQGRRGAPRLAALVHRTGGSTITRSEAEERFLSLVRQAGLPEPELNARLHGYEVDFLWRRQGLVVEVDGYRYHSSRSAFERDSAKGATLSAAGQTVMRVTWAQIDETAYAVVARVAATLARLAR